MLKVDKKAQEFLQKRVQTELDAPFPKTILIDTVSYCNLRCSMCYHKDMKRKPSLMDMEFFKKLIDEIALKRPDARVWLVCYGEPFIDQRMPERIAYAKSKGLKDVVLNSNGVLITSEKAEAFVKAGLDALYVGVDATTQEVYEKLRVNPDKNGSLEKTIQAVLSYKDALDRFGDGKQRLFTQFVVMPINEHQKDDFIEFWKSKGVETKIRPMISWVDKVETPGRNQQIKRLPCKWIINDMMILSDGTVTYCSCDIEGENSTVHLKDVKTIQTAWEVMKPYREMQRSVGEMGGGGFRSSAKNVSTGKVDTQNTDKDYIPQKLNERLTGFGQKDFPRDIVLETTTFCNYKCIMCSHRKMKREKMSMRWPLFMKIVDEVAERGKDTTRLWLCFYGEPLVEKDFADRVWYVKNKGIENVVINSNMSLMTKQKAEEIVKSGLTTIFAAVDGFSNETYDSIRVGGNYQNVVKNILIYKEALSKFGSPEQDIIVQFIEMEQNRHEKEAYLQFWKSHGITTKIRPLLTWHDNTLNQDSGAKRLPCHWMDVFPIASDGRVPFCGCDYDVDCPHGNLKSDTIFEIWNTHFRHYQQIMLDGEWNRLPDFCRGCADWNGSYADYIHVE